MNQYIVSEEQTDNDSELKRKTVSGLNRTLDKKS